MAESATGTEGPAVTDVTVNGVGDAPPGDTPAAPWTHALTNTELHNAPQLTRYTLDAFVDSHLEMERNLGGRVEIPKEDATPEEWSTFYNRLPGMPATAEAYTLTPIEQSPDGALSEGEMAGVLTRFHSLHISNGQAQGMMQLLAEVNAARQQTSADNGQAHIDTALSSLQQLPGWGPLTDHHLAVATEAMSREFGEQPWLETLVRTDKDGGVQPLRTMPAFWQMAYQFGEARGYGKSVSGGPNASGPDSAKGIVNQARADRRAGKISVAEENATMAQHGPLAFSEDSDGWDVQQGGASRGDPMAG